MASAFDPFPGLDRLPTLQGSGVRLRWLLFEDVEDLLRIFGDPEVMRYWSSIPLPDIGAARGLVEEIHGCFRARRLFQWGIAREGDDRVVGTCTLFDVSREHRRAKVGFALGRAFWGRGIGTDALGTLIRFAFESLNLHRLEADADPRNERSLRLLRRHGFRQEGLLRESYFVGDEIQDSAIHGLLRRDWTSVPDPTSPSSEAGSTAVSRITRPGCDTSAR